MDPTRPFATLLACAHPTLRSTAMPLASDTQIAYYKKIRPRSHLSPNSNVLGIKHADRVVQEHQTDPGRQDEARGVLRVDRRSLISISQTKGKIHKGWLSSRGKSVGTFAVAIPVQITLSCNTSPVAIVHVHAGPRDSCNTTGTAQWCSAHFNVARIPSHPSAI